MANAQSAQLCWTMFLLVLLGHACLVHVRTLPTSQSYCCIFHKSSNRAPSEMKTQLSFRLPTLAFEEQVHALTPSVTSQGRS